MAQPATKKTKISEPKQPATKEDQVKELYGQGLNHYQIAKEVYGFEGEEAVSKVAQIVNPASVERAERYKEAN